MRTCVRYNRRLKSKRYRGQNVKRRYIPKSGSKKLRALGIPSLEDKIVQHAASRILESIFDGDFQSPAKSVFNCSNMIASDLKIN